MKVIDPAGQFAFELPLGWGCDLQISHLIEVYFRRWDRPVPRIAVRTYSSAAPPEASDEDWRAAAEKGAGAPCTPTVVRGRAALRVDKRKEGELPERVLLVRGRHLDVRCSYQDAEGAEPQGESALDLLAETLDIPSDREPPRMVPPDAVVPKIQAGWASAQAGDWEKALPLALEVRTLARATYLASVAKGALLPELPALILVIDSLVLAAGATADLVPLREAEQLVIRSLRTLAGLRILTPGRREEVRRALSENLVRIEKLTRLITQREEDKQPTGLPGLGLAALRTDALFARARAEIDAKPDLAEWHCDAALSDLFGALGSLDGRPLPPAPAGPVPEGEGQLSPAERHYRGLSPDEQASLLNALLRRTLLEDVRRGLTLWGEIQSAKQDMAQERAGSGELIRVTAALSAVVQILGGELRPQGDQVPVKATALLSRIEHLIGLADPQSLAAAESAIEYTSALLDSSKEEGPLRAALCLSTAKLLYAQRRTDGALAVIERGLRAAGEMRTITEPLLTLRSLFLLNTGDAEGARKVAEELVKAPEPADAAGLKFRASCWLNLGVIQSKQGDSAAASESLRQAVRIGLRVEPFGEGITRALVVASRAVESADPELSAELTLAATAALDVRRVGVGSDDVRIDFDEALHHRQAYEQLVVRMIESGGGYPAVAAADRSRARALAALLAQKGASERLGVSVSPPALDEPEPQVALRTAARHIVRVTDEAFLKAGYGRPLQAEELRQLVDSLAAPVLLLQPTGGALALFLARPAEAPLVLRSRVPLAAVLAAAEEARRGLGVAGGVRDFTEDAHSAPADLDGALEVLWAALVRPVLEHLRPGEPLLVVPYRELALVPYSLLRARGGTPLGREHALAFTPSLGALHAIRARGTGQPARLARAYIAGEPAAAPGQILRPLPDARVEAEELAAALRRARLPADGLCHRLGGEATLASYRSGGFGADVVHFACHGDLGEPASASCLFLAPDAASDGRLTAAQVPSVRLHEALVFLSACRTGQGRVAADGVVGLGRAFLTAGARAVIASSWSVADPAAAALARHFYAALLGPVRPTVAEALRTSMWEVHDELVAGKIRSADGEQLFPHPVHYAPFVAWGDALAMRYAADADSSG